jgi:hypothetical protein
MFWGGRMLIKYVVGRGDILIVSDEKDVLKGKNASDLDEEMKNFRRKK